MPPTAEPAPGASAEEFPSLTGFTPGYHGVDGVRLHYLRGRVGSARAPGPWLRADLVRVAPADATARREPHGGRRGFAGPRPVGPAASYAGQDVAATLHRFAKLFSPDAPFHLVAHDIGIWNTYPMLAEHPADVRRVVYMEAPIPDRDIYAYPAFTPEEESLVWHFSFFAAGNDLARTLITGSERFFLEHFIRVHATNPDVIVAPSCRTASDKHDFTRRPSTRTVQAPH